MNTAPTGTLRLPFSAQLTLLSLTHALVDACCAMLVFSLVHIYPLSSRDYLLMVIVYNGAAFALQPICGIVSDMFHSAKMCALLGVFAAIGAVGALLHNPWLTVALAGLGNALYHIGGGSAVLVKGGEKAAPSGVFVAPGAVGLALGAYIGSRGVPTVWPFVAALAGAALLIFFADLSPDTVLQREKQTAPSEGWISALLLLLSSVAMRSLIGFAAGGTLEGKRNLLILLVAAAALGKALGGIVADRLGWRRTGVAALLASVVFLSIGRYGVGYVLSGMVLFQMTMPITLSAVYRIFPQRPGLTFGLCCLALILGAAPVFTPMRHIFESTMILVSGIFLCTLFFYIGINRVALQSGPAVK